MCVYFVRTHLHCMYTCTCAYVHTHSYAQIMHTHLYTHINVCVRVCVCAYAYYVQVYIQCGQKMDKCKELPHWVTPPQPKAGAPVCYFRELWASTTQTPEAGPSTRRSTDCALQLWCGHPKSHLDLSGISTASGLVHPQPRPGSQFTIFLRPG